MAVQIDLSAKTALVFGVASERSIAWNIAKTLAEGGCRLVIGFQERMRANVEKLAGDLNDPMLLPCDVTDDSQINNFFETVKSEIGSFDYLIHSLAFCRKEFLKGEFFAIDRETYSTALEISAFSLSRLISEGKELLNPGGSIITMTYLGSSFAIQNYNAMGAAKAALEASVRYLAVDLGKFDVTVNAISAGPLKTLAASGIEGFDRLLELVPKRAPLRRNIEAQDVGNTALFLCSDLARNITGQVIYVDAGFSTVMI